MATLPPADVQYIRENDGTFYISSRSNVPVQVADLRTQLISICVQALDIGRTLRAASDVGVAEATAVVNVLNTVAAFSDEQAATTFLAALRATAPE